MATSSHTQVQPASDDAAKPEAAAVEPQSTAVRPSARPIDARVKALITTAIHECMKPDGWAPLTDVGSRIKKLDPSFVLVDFGFVKLGELMQSLSDVIELRRDDSRKTPLLFARIIDSTGRSAVTAPRAPAASSPGSSATPNSFIATPQRSFGAKSGRSGAVPLWRHALIPQNRYIELAEEIALEETWHFGERPTADFPYPILKNYLNYTFIRLQHEQKILISRDDDLCAFNTGLVDRRFLPIFALFGGDRKGGPRPWYLIAFCIAGEGSAGKTLNRRFNPLPEPARYFTNPADLFFNVDLGKPSVDWRHILYDHPERLPLDFVREHCPGGFTPADSGTMSDYELADYRDAFARAMKDDPRAERRMTRDLEDALDIALRRTSWNFKTAIPTYYPASRRVNLLLPLRVMSDDRIDLALVVERTGVDSYQGHTVLPLEWAYTNARLICRPDSDWLTPALIKSESENSLNDGGEGGDREDSSPESELASEGPAPPNLYAGQTVQGVVNEIKSSGNGPYAFLRTVDLGDYYFKPNDLVSDCAWEDIVGRPLQGDIRRLPTRGQAGAVHRVQFASTVVTAQRDSDSTGNGDVG